MKKTTILLGMLSISMVYAQATSTAATPPQGKVGVNTENPTEILHVEGTARVKELPESGANKIYNGAATKTGTFTPTKTVVADANGVLGSIPYVLPAGTGNKTALQWNGSQWVAVAPTNVTDTNTNIYTDNGTITSGASRVATIPANASLTFEKTGGGTGIALKTADNQAIHLDFQRGDKVGYVGFAASSSTDVTLGNKVQGANVVLSPNGGLTEVKSELKISTVNNGNRNDRILVGSSNIVKSIAVTDIVPNGTTDGQTLSWNGSSWVAQTPNYKEPWKIVGGTTQATDADGNIYRKAKIGIGDFSKISNVGGELEIIGGGTSQLRLSKGSGANDTKWDISSEENGLTFTARKTDFNGRNFVVRNDGSFAAGRGLLNTEDTGHFYYDDANRKLSIDGTTTGKVSLHLSRRLRVDEVPEKTGAVKVLVWGDTADDNGKVVGYRDISSVLNGSVGGTPWRKVGQGNNTTKTDVVTDAIYHDGFVGIGDFKATGAGHDNYTDSNINYRPAGTKLSVRGKVMAESFIGKHGAEIFPDYVFQKYYTGTSSIKADYNFQSLSQVEDFVKANGHLPGYKSAEAIKKAGYIDVMETQLTNVEKIEELYLHLMEKEKEVKALEAKNADLEARLERLEKLLK